MAGALIDDALEKLDGLMSDLPEGAAPRGGNVPTVKSELEAIFQAALDKAFPDAGESVLLAACNNPKNGDYQCNNAMPLFGKLKGTPSAPKNPRACAEAICAALPESELIEGTSLAGPGFINIKLSPSWLGARLTGMLDSDVGIACWAPALPQSRVVVDFSSPNVAKEMHVGHLRSTIIGDTVCKTLEFCGCEVKRLNHVGDWGTQFGMLIQYMSTMRPEGLGEEGGADEDVADLQVLYRAAKAKFDEDAEFKTRSREAVKTLQGGDPTYLKAWARICEASRREFQRIYDRLDVTLEERGESFYNPLLPSMVEDLKSLGVAEESDGATVVWVEGSEIPLIIQKSDGGFGYASTDMAALRQRLDEEKADWIVYVTDTGQAGHFDMVFKAARKAGWLKDDDPAAGTTRIDHVGFGLVLGEDGKKFKTRSGDVVRLVELLDEAMVRCRTVLTERRIADGEAVDEAEIEAAARAMGYGAVKYADLKNSRLTNYKFSFDRMLDFNGNTAVYLLYAYARICGIMRKSGVDFATLDNSAIKLETSTEVALALHISKFPEAIEEMLQEIMPNRITDYLYELSERFNQFYVECKVLGSEQQTSRLLLTESTAITMRTCFQLLGIQPLERL